MKSTGSIHSCLVTIGIAALALLAASTGLQAQVQCIETNGVKYVQPPNLAGFDVSDSIGYVLADDFICVNSGPISDIHIWGSWLNNTHGAITNFWIGIYSDVPAGVNGSYSHPGRLLWSQAFPQGTFAETALEPSQEQFISPASVNILGPDTEVWYYCFYPTNPFVQTGTSAAPQVYWLAAFAQGNFGPGYDSIPQYGWKTTASVQSDASVNTPWTGTLPGNNAPWNITTTPANSPEGAVPLDLAFKLTTPTNTTSSCCPDTNGVKYLQPPNLKNGVDVDARDIRGGTLADDFPCTTPGPITDIHLWGSWLNDQVDNNAIFTLSIWSDVPALPTTGTPSHPGAVLWTQTFTPNDYFMCPYLSLPEPFDDPNYTPPPALLPFGTSTNLYYLCFYPTNPFVQQGTAANPTIYWLSVTETDPNAQGQYWGWKSSSSNFNDAAVFTMHPPSSPWISITQAGANLDFAFKLNTATNQLVQPECVETNGVKTIQGPNTLGGFDVRNTPYVLADDFLCKFRGPISDIHLWGSWLSDAAITNLLTFWLGVYDDVPVSANNPYSHPGTNLLWQQWFAPGQYAETIWTANASEQFLDPGQPPTSGPSIIGSDSIVWYYCFSPTNPFEQLGLATAPVTYWLAAYAQLPAGVPYNYGWKTTTNVTKDISVHAVWPGAAPTNNPGWTPTMLPSGAPLDLSFKLTTPTNVCGPILIRYLTTNLVVLTWSSGFLQVSAGASLLSTNVEGTYVDVPGATSPYTNDTTVVPLKFFRLRCY